MRDKIAITVAITLIGAISMLILGLFLYLLGYLVIHALGSLLIGVPIAVAFLAASFFIGKYIVGVE